MEQPTSTEQSCCHSNSSNVPQITTNKKTRTWAKEFSAILFAALIYFGYVGQTDVLEILVWPFTTFAVAAFGFKSDTIKEAVAVRKTK